jgi:hypothetical protein
MLDLALFVGKGKESKIKPAKNLQRRLANREQLP